MYVIFSGIVRNDMYNNRLKHARSKIRVECEVLTSLVEYDCNYYSENTNL